MKVVRATPNRPAPQSSNLEPAGCSFPTTKLEMTRPGTFLPFPRDVANGSSRQNLPLGGVHPLGCRAPIPAIGGLLEITGSGRLEKFVRNRSWAAGSDAKSGKEQFSAPHSLPVAGFGAPATSGHDIP